MSELVPSKYLRPHRDDYPPEIEIRLIWWGHRQGARRYDVLVVTGPQNEETRTGKLDDIDFGDTGTIRYRRDSHNPSITELCGPMNAGPGYDGTVHPELPDYGIGFWRARRAELEPMLFDATDAILDLLEELLPDALATASNPDFQPVGRFLPRARSRGAGQFSEFGVRFADLADFYRLFFNQRRLNLERLGEPFDLAVEIQDWVDYWQQTEGDINVPGQRTWYVQHGPEAGETAEEYWAKAAEFEQLILANLRVLRQMQRHPELV